MPLGLAGCQSAAKADATAEKKPELAPVDPALVPLAFLAGTWSQTQPRGAMIEEHWMQPRGKSMVGSFRRILGNGATPFYEFTQIVSEADGVHLRQIHVHGNFETDPRRKEAMHLRLDRSEPNLASFVPVANAGSLERVTYALGADGVLSVRVEERPTKTSEATDSATTAPEPQVLEFRMTRVK